MFRDNVTYDNLFYMGRFDFVVYEKRGKSELPVLRIELDGKEHFEDEVVRERDRQKMRSVRRTICRSSAWKTLMRGVIIISKRY